MIKPCDGARCTSAYQDRKYGKGLRVQNEMANGGRRCTVCERETAPKTFAGKAKPKDK